MAERATPRVRRARAAIAGGDRAEMDRLRQRFEDERSTPGITRTHQRDLDRAIGELQHGVWGDEEDQQPMLRAVTPEEDQDQPKPKGGLKRAAHATRIHARQAKGKAGQRAGQAGRRARLSAGTRWQQTGIPSSAESGVQLLMRTIGGIVGMSFLYLILSPNGSKALSLTSNGLVYGMKALADPNVDPLRASSSDVQLSKLNAATETPQSTSTAPAASVSAVSTPSQPSMLGDPFATFPTLASNPTTRNQYQSGYEAALAGKSAFAAGGGPQSPKSPYMRGYNAASKLLHQVSAGAAKGFTG